MRKNLAKYNKETKQRALDMYANDVYIVDIAAEIGCSRNTVDYWIAQKDPCDWKIYKQTAVNERIKGSLNEIRKQAAKVTKTQLEDSIDLRSVTKATLIELAKRVKNGANIDKELTSMLKDLEGVFSGVQKQQNTVFDLPSHRIKIDDTAASPITDVGVDDLKKMSKTEIMGLLFDLNGDGND